ncbi:glycoprotein [Boana pugnax lyssa-like virus 1]|uniref:Glycoprotein n=1 Tax=Boana pugnax lyssa-like virus 1 TaxID=2985438 RepID=A0AAE9T7I1_9RHAB|nr:glycoprotein [Boana pugnax lyssa-like virus 1]
MILGARLRNQVFVIWFTLLSIALNVQSQVPLYTIPARLNDWHPVQPDKVKCPLNHFDVFDGCAQGSGSRRAKMTILADNHGAELTIKGYTCTGIRMTVTTWVSFFGYLTVTQSNDHIIPTVAACKRLRAKMIENPGIYDDQLIRPTYDSAWLQSLDVSKEALLIHPSVKTKIDPYNDVLTSSLFPGGTCEPGYRTGACPTIHGETLWIMEEGEEQDCAPFEEQEVSIHVKNSVPCGISDHHNYPRSYNGSCILTFCNHDGLRFRDGFWVTPIPRDINPPRCSRDTLIVSPSASYYQNEESLLNLVRGLRDKCLDALEGLQLSGRLSQRKLGLFRPLNPGPGKAYRISNELLEESDVVYKAVYSWSEVLKNSSCLLVDGKCYTEESFFNGITNSGEGGIVIPEREIFTQMFNEELLIQQEVMVEHPIIVSILNSILMPNDTDYITSMKHASQSGIMGLGLSSVWDIILTVVMAIIFLIFGPLIIYAMAKLSIFLCKSLRGKKKPRHDQGGMKPIQIRIDDYHRNSKALRDMKRGNPISWSDFQKESQF